MRHSVSTVAALIAAGTLTLAACGSSGKSSTSASGTSAKASAATFKVMVMGDFTSSVLPVPETVPAVKAALKGVPGIQIVTCDSQGAPNAAIACEHTAITDKVAAVVNGFGYATEDDATLAQAGIPILGSTNDTSPISFDVAPSLSSYTGLGAGAAEAGCKTVGVLYLDGTSELVGAIGAGLTFKGAKLAAEAPVAINAPDLAPAVAKLVQAKVSCIILSVSPTMVVQAMTAIKQSGAHPQVLGVSAVFPKQIVTALGSLANGVITTDIALDPSDTAPIVGQIRSAMQAIDPGSQLTVIALTSWVAGRLIAAAARKLHGSVTAAQMLAALNGLRNVNVGGVEPPLSMVPLKAAPYRRTFDHYGINYKIVNGVPHRLGGFYDLEPALDAQ
jgi:ABC-type branched-subunit amino acid transport system substrate-binding protein